MGYLTRRALLCVFYPILCGPCDGEVVSHGQENLEYRGEDRKSVIRHRNVALCFDCRCLGPVTVMKPWELLGPPSPILRNQT